MSDVKIVSFNLYTGKKLSLTLFGKRKPILGLLGVAMYLSCRTFCSDDIRWKQCVAASHRKFEKGLAGSPSSKNPSCDTFVVLPPLTAHGGVIFGKNSDRPRGEVQEVRYQPAETHERGTKLRCTYISIEQVPHTYAVMISKPAWMWGAEMGANEKGVVIGNEAVWTKMEKSTDIDEKLLGMDLVRLGLERSKTAAEGVNVIVSLLEKHGQGGPCSDTVENFTYHNSFLIADPKSAWVLETAGQEWAAEEVTGYRNISNDLSITVKIDKHSANLFETAKANGFWNGQGQFNFASVYGTQGDLPSGRYSCGKELLKKLTVDNKFSLARMLQILRDKKCGICRSMEENFPTMGSQASVLAPFGGSKLSCHYFTATPDPSNSVYKPFIFTSRVKDSIHSYSRFYNPDPAQTIPRFQSFVDRSHNLFRLNSDAMRKKSPGMVEKLNSLELKLIEKAESIQDGKSAWEIENLWKNAVEAEMEVYGKI